jgi:hypothetical protein
MSHPQRSLLAMAGGALIATTLFAAATARAEVPANIEA